MVSETIKMQVTGQNIIDAVKKVAIEPVVIHDNINGRDVFVAGQKSNFSYEHLGITVDDSGVIDPEKTYDQFKVTEQGWGRWGGMIYDTEHKHDAVIKAVKAFAESIRGELVHQTWVTKIDEEMIVFEFEGITYECSQLAYRKNKIVLPDGKVLEADDWFEGLPPQPSGLIVVDELPVAIKI